MFYSHAYSFRFITLEKYVKYLNTSNDSNHSSTFAVLVIAAFIKKRRKKKTKPASNANTQPSTEYYSVRMQIIIILCFMYMTIHGESKSTTSCVLSSMSRISTSNFEYEWCENNIQISMNAYKYQKLYSMTRIFYLNTYCWSLISFSF